VDLLRERQVGPLEHERDRLAHVADHDLQLCKAIEHTGCDQPGRVQPGVHVPAPGPDRQDWVFGIKFRPAGFRPLLGSAVAVLTNRALPSGRSSAPAARR
jgi:hypothetical protein